MTWLQKECGMIHAFGGSELKVPAFVESIGYPKADGDISCAENGPARLLAEAYSQLPEVCKHLPVHFIYGRGHDFVSVH